jgi:hypothetical protein
MLATGAVVVALAFAFSVRLSAGPIPLAFLDRPIAAAIAGLAPELDAVVGATALARSGRGVAVRVSGVRLMARDGRPILTLPELAVRPSFGALLRGRLVIARVDVAGAELALTRRTDGTWAVGTEEGGAGVAVAELLGATSASPTSGTSHLPRLGLTGTRLTVDDQRTGDTITLADGDLLLAPRAGKLDVTVRAVLDLARTRPPGRGTLHLPIRAEVSALLSDQRTLAAVDFTVAGGAGELTVAEDAGPPFALTELAAAGHYHPDVETLRFTRLAAVVGGSRVEAKTSVILGATPLLALDGTVDALALTALTRLWPAELAASVRTWLVANVRTGMLRRCRVQLGLHGAPAPAGPGAVSVAPAAPDAVDVACDFDGVTASYLNPLDPIRAAVGSARLTTERFAVTVTAGAVGACRVEAGTLAMNLALDPPLAAITADVSGAGADVLALVDRPPLRLVTPLGIAPKDLGGASRVHAELRLPIKRGVTDSEVAVQATAALTGASLPPLAGGIGIENGALTVRIQGRALEIKGTTNVTGLPGVTTPVTMALTVAPGADARTQQVTLALDGEGLVGRGTARFAGGTAVALVIDRLKLGRHDIAGTVRRRPNGDLDATLTGARLDLEALRADPRFTAADDAALATGYTLAVQLGSVLADEDLEVRNLRGSLQGTGGSLGSVALAGSLAPSGDFRLTLDGPPAARRFVLTSDQAGRVLHALGGFEQFVGGTLKLDAATDQRGLSAFLDGKLVIRDFKVVRAPNLAKVLAVGSLGAMASLLQGDGLPVAKARFPFRWENERLTVTDVRAVGAIGLTADGVVDRKAGTCDVRGNIIPAYTLNSALGKVPLVGQFLVGGKGQGVFGIDYRVTGKIADPQVSVNPLTSVAPTRLRAWFVDPFTREADDTDPAPRRRRGR